MRWTQVALCILLTTGISAFASTNSAQAALSAPEQASEAALEQAADHLAAQDAQDVPAVEKPVKQDIQKKHLTEAEIPVLVSKPAQKTTVSSIWLRLIGSLFFILTVAGILIVVIKKMAKKQNIGGQKAKIELLHQFHLGPKKSLALIRVAGEHILVGVTDQSINMIKSVAFIDDEAPDSLPQDFNNFLEDDFTMEPISGRTRVV